ncbi:MAG: hypothetical protein KDM81_10385 [Verrucomicrobiae bacterium]|nr:hypothetical protein [Verrucomicrobiae bacterium]MCP5520940.1 hypothetical protein [Verrucomicrobiales bacterium]
MRIFRRKRNSGEHRYYLLPGMGRSNRRFRKKTHIAAVIVGILASLLFGTAIYLIQRP